MAGCADCLDLVDEHPQGNSDYLNQYQSGMCISGVLKTPDTTSWLLTSPLGPKRVAPDSPRLAICTFHLGFSLGRYLHWPAGDHRHRLRRVAARGPEALPALRTTRLVTRCRISKTGDVTRDLKTQL